MAGLPSDTRPLPASSQFSIKWVLHQLNSSSTQNCQLNLGNRPYVLNLGKGQGPNYHFQKGQYHSSDVHSQSVSDITRQELPSHPLSLLWVGARLLFLILFFCALWLKGKMSEVIYQVFLRSFLSLYLSDLICRNQPFNIPPFSIFLKLNGNSEIKEDHLVFNLSINVICLHQLNIQLSASSTS